jgi:ATP-dependent Clp protease, protease subunit
MWEIKAKAGDVKAGEMYLYGEIGDSFFGDGVTDAEFAGALAALGGIDTLSVYVNSPGGDLFMGLAIYNVLCRCPAKKKVHVDGMAASAASLICMAGDEIIMPNAARMMIHNGRASLRNASAKQLREQADFLDRLNADVCALYAARAKRESTDVQAMMDAETWMTGREALEAGFCDALDDMEVAACADVAVCFAAYDHPPEWPDTTDNGGESQPAADNSTDTQTTAALGAQTRRFHETKTRMMEGLA